MSTPANEPGRQATENETRGAMLRVSMADAIILYFHAWRCAVHPEIGHQDENISWAKFKQKMDKISIYVNLPTMEHFLWSINTLDDMQTERFWHPTNKSITSFMEGINARQEKFEMVFDYKYNTIKLKVKTQFKLAKEDSFWSVGDLGLDAPEANPGQGDYNGPIE